MTERATCKSMEMMTVIESRDSGLQDHKGRSNTPKRIKFLLNQFYEHLIEQGLAYDNPTLKCKVSNRYKKTYMDSKGQHKNNENYKAIPVAERARFIRALDWPRYY